MATIEYCTSMIYPIKTLSEHSMQSPQTSPHYLEKELYAFIHQPLFHFLEKGSLDGILFWDLTQQQNMWISPGFWHILGYHHDAMEHLVSNWKAVLFKEDFSTALEKLNKHIQYPEYPFNRLLRYRHKNGSTLWLRCRAMVLHNHDQKPTRMIFLHNDASAQMQDKDEIQYYQNEIAKLRQEMQSQSFLDPLTSIYAHKGVEENCKYLIETSKRDGSLLSVAMFEIDALDQLRAQHEEERTDKIFKALAHALYDSTRRVDIIGRFDGEKFVVLMPNTSKEDATVVSWRICKYIQRHPCGGVDITLSCGVATRSSLLQEDTQTIYEQLILSTDEALHHAKKESNRVQHYDNIHIVIPQIEPQDMSDMDEQPQYEDYYR